MKKLNFFHLLLLSFALLPCSCAKHSIDPLIGTGAHGHTFPGASLPFGFVQLSPDNSRPGSDMSGWDWCSGYHYSANVITGFSHTHLSGTGIGDLCDLLLAPRPYRLGDNAFIMNKKTHNTALNFSHDNEVAALGYYSVNFKNDGIMAELTASTRVGMHRYQFPAGKPASLVLDLAYSINWDHSVETRVRQAGPMLFTGHRHSTGWAPDQKLFFAMYLDQKPDEVRYFIDGKPSADASEDTQNYNTRLVLTFERGGRVQVKMGISAVDVEGAINNVNSEIPHWGFDSVRKDAVNAWAQIFNRITATHISSADAQIFNTAIYHAFLSPNTVSDADGRYRGADGKIHTADGFAFSSTFSLWDTFRASHPLFTLLVPERIDGFVKSMLEFNQQKGQLPIWALWNNETNCMIGYHAVPVLVDAYLKGLTTASGEEILNACVAMADRDVDGLKSYKALGYVDAAENQSCSKTLEYAYDDSAIARLAEKLGKKDIAERFRQRAMNFRNLFDPQTGFMRGKDAKGKWVEPFDPTASDPLL